MNKQIIEPRTINLPVEGIPCNMNIAGYSLDNFKTINPEGYTILCQLGERCDGLSFFPNTAKIVLDHDQQCNLLNNFDEFIPNVAKELGVSTEVAVDKTLDFFKNKELIIQPKGVQGKIYGAMQAAQNTMPVVYTMQFVSMAKTAGVTGIELASASPMVFVGASYLGALFFVYCGTIAGNNTIGTVCNFTGYVLTRPMRGVEVTLNGIVLRPLSRIIGLPLLLNGTQEMLAGQGLSLQEYGKIGLAFERIANSTLTRKLKKIINVLRNKD